MTKKDIRVLCSQHAQEILNAGYCLIRTGEKYKCECDKCNRIGWTYELVKPRRKAVESWQRKNTS